MSGGGREIGSILKIEPIWSQRVYFLVVNKGFKMAPAEMAATPAKDT